MIFDQDPEVGAFLLLNWENNKVEGYLYRKEEIKEPQTRPVMAWSNATPDNPDAGGVLIDTGKTVTEEVIVRVDIYIMDIKGNWFHHRQSPNPYLFMCDRLLDSPKLCGDKNGMDWGITADFTEEVLWEPNQGIEFAWIPEGKEGDAEKYRIRWDDMVKSVAWIRNTLNTADPTKNQTQHLLRELDKFEYNIGNR